MFLMKRVKPKNLKFLKRNIVKNIKMKSTLSRYSLLSFALSILFSISCIAQSGQTSNKSPKVENYTYGNLDLKVIPFGLGKEINVGRINEDGTIHLNWPKINLDTIESSTVFMSTTKNALLGGMSYCDDGQIDKNTQECLVVDTQNIYLFKNDQRVGVLFPASQVEMIDNESANVYENLVLGSTVSWFYSNGTCNFKANCSENTVWEGKYDFTNERNYNIQLKTGWNMVQFDMLEKEEWEDDVGSGNMERKGSKKTINKIPENINWYIKMF